MGMDFTEIGRNFKGLVCILGHQKITFFIFWSEFFLGRGEINFNCNILLGHALLVYQYLCIYCFVLQRTRLVLAAKGIEYECININLKDKPEWFFDVNPVGKVPVIEHPDGKVIYESAICCGRHFVI